jgi:hypothetical protein
MRIPILLWGDLVKGRQAITRRSLVGDSAHECMYAWVYLTDFLAVRRLFSYLNIFKETSDGSSIVSSMDNELWKLICRKKNDPRYQINKSSFETASYLNALIFSYKRGMSSVVELGQTFFTAIDKFDFVYQLSKDHFSLNYNLNQLRWIGIDNSEFCNATAKILHGSYQDNIEIYNSIDSLPQQDRAIFHSRFVCSYVFSSTLSFVEFLSKNFECAVIEDAFSSINREIHTQNHGQNELFFNLQEFNRSLAERGFETYLIDFYGDHPAGTEKCLVVKLLVLKKESIDKEKFQNFLRYHGFQNQMNNQSEHDLLSLLMSKITLSEWKAIYKNKKINPVWGRTDFRKASLLEKLSGYFKKWFEISRNGYRSYNLRGENAEQEICRFIRDSKL